MQGMIDVDTVMAEARALQRWLERNRRARLHREEQEVLQAYWSASDKQQIVAAHREVFDRIAVNRKRAAAIRVEEQRILEEYKQAQIKQ